MRLTKRPVLCNYYVTYRCNAACGFCDIWEKPSPYVNIENVRENLRDLKKLGVKVIDFTGGEPLLHKELPIFLKLAKDLNFITTVTTNTLLYPKHAEALAGLIDMLHFSLDAPTAEEHNQSRGVNCFDHFLRSIQIAKSLGERPDILFTVNSSNIHHIKQVYEEITVPNQLMLILNPIFSYSDIGSELSEKDLEILEHWGKRKGVYLNKAFLTLRRNGGNNINDPSCFAGSTTVVISPENNLILPCYHLNKAELPIDGNLIALRQSETVQKEIQLEGRHEKCQGCTINCYFQPSFSVNLNKYFFESLSSTLKYAFHKGTWKELLKS